jgi:cystathionine beta-lyase
VPGLACSFAIIPDAALREKFSAVSNNMSIETSSMGLTASRVAYSGKADGWLNAQRKYLTANRDFVMNYLENNLPGVRMTKPDATYLLWLDFSEYALQPSPYEFFLKNAKVAFSAGEKFGRGSEQFVRLNFGTSRKILVEALQRITKALK